MKTEWICCGFERDEDCKIIMIWECAKCGYKIGGGLETPNIECPQCGKEGKDDR